MLTEILHAALSPGRRGVYLGAFLFRLGLSFHPESRRFARARRPGHGAAACTTRTTCNHPLRTSMIRTFSFTLLFMSIAVLLPSQAAQAQAGRVEGRVAAAETGETLPGVNVGLAGTVLGAATDADGAYRIEGVAPGRYTVVVTAIGYAPAERAVTVEAGAAAEASFTLEPSRYELAGVEVSAARTGAAAAALPTKVTVIEPQELARQRSLVSSPAELLSNLIPSFAPARQKLTGAGESFRGRKPLFLVDGVPQSNPLRDGSREGFTIDPEVIERVEVLFGANAIQGLGATGGIVNYVTIRPPAGGALVQRASVGLTSDDAFADDGYGWRGHYTAAKKLGAFDVLASVSYEERGLQYDGRGRAIALDNVQGDIADSRSRNLLAKVGWEPTPHQRLQLMVNDFRLAQEGHYASEPGDRETGLPAFAVEGDPEGTEPFNDVTTASLDYEHTAVAGGTFSAKLYLQDFAALYGGGRFGVFQDPALAPEGELFDQSENNSEKVGARLTFTRPGVLAAPVDVVAGVDVLRDQTFQRLALTDRNWVPSTTFYNAAPFAQLDVAATDWLLVSGGVRLELAELDVPDFTTIAGNREDRRPVRVTGGSPTFAEPLLNVGAVVTPLVGWRLYGSVAQGFTMPDVGRVLRGVSEEGTAVDDFLTLDPIKTDNLEFGTTYATRRALVGVTYFASTSDYGLRLVPNEDGIFQVRREPTRTRGWELTGRLDPTPRLSLGAAYSRLQGHFDADDDGSFDSDLGAADIGPDRLNLTATVNRGGRLSGRLQTFTYVDRTFRDGEGAETARFDGYTTVDAAIAYALGAATLSLSVANLLDAQYITYYGQAATTRADRYFAGRGRTFTLRVETRF